MALNADDDVQQIFDTINSLGVKLTTAELLKNYLYANKATVELYQEYWYSVFEIDEDAIEFWNRDRTSGRVRRTTVELFLYSVLVILKESNVKMESLFKEFKNYLSEKNDNDWRDFAKELCEYAKVYRKIPDGENLSDIAYQEHEKRFFHIIREFDITTIFPLVLFLYKKVDDKEGLAAIFEVLESYIARRTICKLTTKNYNNLFLSLLAEVKQMHVISAKNVKDKLLQFKEDTNRFPNDEEFKLGFENSHLINKYSREVLYCIALYHLNHDYVDNRKLNLSGFSVEHIMPKNWSENWMDLSVDEGHRKHKLLTLGNLTLVKGKLNSSMRDSSWAKKKESLRSYSTLKQTVDYLNLEKWDEEAIKKRGQELFEIASNMWSK